VQRRLPCETIWVGLLLQLFPTFVEHGAIQSKLPRQTHQFKIVRLQIHINKKPPAREQWRFGVYGHAGPLAI
jgi:hypothetical protein